MSLRRRRLETAILSPESAGEIADQVLGLFPVPIRGVAARINVAEIVRFHAVATRFRETRTAKNLTITEVSQQLKVPQYRVRAIESSALREVDPGSWTGMQLSLVSPSGSAVGRPPWSNMGTGRTSA